MRRYAVVLICSLVALMAVGALLTQSLFVIQRIAAVSNPQGSITIRAQGQNAFVPLQGRERVMAGTVVKTGGDGSLTLNWVDGSRIKVGPNTTMEVLKCQVNKANQSDNYLFRLDLGRIWVRVLKSLSQTSKFEIRTPTATAAVRGTIFSVAVDEAGATTVSVLKGQVELTSGDKSLAVREAQLASIGEGAVGTVLDQGEAEKSEWGEVRDVSLPALRVDAPADGKLPPGAASISVAGVVERGAELTVNGQPVKPAFKGKFEATVPVAPDAKDLEIVVRAVDRKGFESVVKKHLTR